ncbi:MAG: aminopeptidase [Spirochaetia bacterium]|nr:aminopeptidase [Spirochaetia bacterium]
MKIRHIGRLLSLGAVSVLCMGLSSCWYVRQASFFLQERRQAVPVARITTNPETPVEVQEFLARVADIRLFSHTELGLSETDNFTTFVPMIRDHVAVVISACADDSFERYLWWYPVLGSMPYRGFYVREDADFTHAQLRRQGYDVLMRKVDAFSSLGLFKDPLYSFMVNYETGELADLIIHESAHATLFLKGSNQFNEEFATFVGRKGAELHLAARYGADSQELESYRKQRRDSEVFAGFLRETAMRLEAVYSREDLGREAKLEYKHRILAERKMAYTVLAEGELSGSIYAHFEMALVNNAYLDLYRLYEEDLSLYQDYLDVVAKGDLRDFIAKLSVLTRHTRRDDNSIKQAMSEAISACCP